MNEEIKKLKGAEMVRILAICKNYQKGKRPTLKGMIKELEARRDEILMEYQNELELKEEDEK